MSVFEGDPHWSADVAAEQYALVHGQADDVLPLSRVHILPEQRQYGARQCKQQFPIAQPT
jgi:hypothetical protein